MTDHRSSFGIITLLLAFVVTDFYQLRSNASNQGTIKTQWNAYVQQGSAMELTGWKVLFGVCTHPAEKLKSCELGQALAVTDLKSQEFIKPFREFAKALPNGATGTAFLTHVTTDADRQWISKHHNADGTHLVLVSSEHLMLDMKANVEGAKSPSAWITHNGHSGTLSVLRPYQDPKALIDIQLELKFDNSFQYLGPSTAVPIALVTEGSAHAVTNILETTNMTMRGLDNVYLALCIALLFMAQRFRCIDIFYMAAVYSGLSVIRNSFGWSINGRLHRILELIPVNPTLEKWVFVTLELGIAAAAISFFRLMWFSTINRKHFYAALTAISIAWYVIVFQTGIDFFIPLSGTYKSLLFSSVGFLVGMLAIIKHLRTPARIDTGFLSKSILLIAGISCEFVAAVTDINSDAMSRNDGSLWHSVFHFSLVIVAIQELHRIITTASANLHFVLDAQNKLKTSMSFQDICLDSIVLLKQLVPSLRSEPISFCVKNMRNLSVVEMGQFRTDQITFKYTVSKSNLEITRHFAQICHTKSLPAEMLLVWHDYMVSASNRMNQIFIERYSNKALSEFNRWAFGVIHLADVKPGSVVTKMAGILFFDIEGSTSMRLQAPDQLETIFLDFMNKFDRILNPNEYSWEHTTGDGVYSLGRDPNQTLEPLFALRENLGDIQDTKCANLRLNFRIGIHFGVVKCSLIETEFKSECIQVSTDMDTCSRTESIAKSFGACCLVTEQALDAGKQRNSRDFRSLGHWIPLGQIEPIQLFEFAIFGVWTNAESFALGIEAIQKGNRQSALDNFTAATTQMPSDKVAKTMLARVTNDEDWRSYLQNNGVYRPKEK